MPKLKLTATSIKAIAPPPFKLAPDGKKTPQQVIYFCPDHLGLGVRVTSSGKKSFVVEKWHDGKPVRRTIGDAEQLTVHMAWREAQIDFGKMAGGINPNDEKRADKAREISLGEVLADYLKARKNLAPRTIADYQGLVDSHLVDWKDKPLVDITKDMIEKRHSVLGEDSGHTQANYCMRVLRALFNFAIEKYEASDEPILTINPVRRLSGTKAWFKENRRTTYVKPDQLKAWFAALAATEVDEGRDYLESARDYLTLIVLSGLRKSEGLGLKWADIDLANKHFTIRDTKNHIDHTLPMSDYLFDLFERRHKMKRNDYVFPGIGKRNAHQQEPKKGVAKVIKLSGVAFTLHDLRRTFITVAESLDISAYAVKRLVNHKMKNDVTNGYIITDVERLRKPMQQITDFILRSAGVVPSATEPSAAVTEADPLSTVADLSAERAKRSSKAA